MLAKGIIANIMNLASAPGYDRKVYMGLVIVIATLIQYGVGSLNR
jgi:ribose/xylose/arabinose/galactoside ABC-type transport system permease subunit